MAGNETVQRHMIADYLNVGTEEETYELMGTGFNAIDEEFGAKTDSKQYINSKNASTAVTGYEAGFEFDSDLIKSEKAVMKLYEIGASRKTGIDAEVDYIRVELFNPTPLGSGTEFKARKFRCAAALDKAEGEGGETIKISGTLHQVGDAIEGKFNTSTKTFTPNE